MKTRTWILLIGLVLIACSLLIWCFWKQEDCGRAEVWQDGKLMYTLDLSRDCEIRVESSDGYNIITVRDGKAAVTGSDCPNGYCMQQGFQCSGQIVCLPHRLVIRFTDQNGLDGQTG